jgi:hypothetical protein
VRSGGGPAQPGATSPRADEVSGAHVSDTPPVYGGRRVAAVALVMLASATSCSAKDDLEQPSSTPAVPTSLPALTTTPTFCPTEVIVVDMPDLPVQTTNEPPA